MLKLILNNYYLIIFCRNCPSQYLNLCEHLPVEVQMESCTQVKIIAALNFNLFMVSFIHSFLCSFLCLFLSSFIHTFSQPVHMSIPPSVPPSVRPSIHRFFRLSFCQSVSQSVSHAHMNACLHSFKTFIHVAFRPSFLFYFFIWSVFHLQFVSLNNFSVQHWFYCDKLLSQAVKQMFGTPLTWTLA